MGTVQIDGSTPKITVGNATAEDATILFDGNAQDFYIALDDSADDLLIGLGSTVGTTPIIAIDENKLSTFSGAITVGVDDTGHDVKLFGATAGSFALWDESANSLLLTDSTPIKIGDAQDLTLYHDGSNSYITNAVGALKIATETSGIALTIGHTTSETTVADNLTVTGTVTITGGQIVFPGTQAASANVNTLDDYEEGVWTGVISDGTNNATMSASGGVYTKIGDLVNVGGKFATSNLGSVSGAIRLTGLPFTGLAGATGYRPLSCFGENLNVTAGYTMGGHVEPDNTYANIFIWDAAGGMTAMTGAEWSADGTMFLNATYKV
jgi:hypothetical protein